ncbi:hypothetical protein EDD15DRAFT_2203723 [Pisolithus albus]|nr:hypothetical protein EDD15DRAFT_2203723 [Pisolithus albus]
MYCGTSMCHHLPTLFGRVMTGKLTFTDPTSSFGWLDLGRVEVVRSLAAAREFLTLHGDPSSLFPCSTAQGIQYERQASQHSWYDFDEASLDLHFKGVCRLLLSGILVRLSHHFASTIPTSTTAPRAPLVSVLDHLATAFTTPSKYGEKWTSRGEVSSYQAYFLFPHAVHMLSNTSHYARRRQSMFCTTRREKYKAVLRRREYSRGVVLYGVLFNSERQLKYRLYAVAHAPKFPENVLLDKLEPTQENAIDIIEINGRVKRLTAYSSPSKRSNSIGDPPA